MKDKQMENLNTKLEKINQKFKNNALTSSIVNILLLGLVFVFFSIGFDLTKKLIVDFVNLSWASIFPTLIDLATVAGLILVLRYFANTLQRPDFFLHLDSKEIENLPANENNPKIVEFLNSSIYTRLLQAIWYTIGLFFINYTLNIFFEAANNQFSPLNEWYLLSSNFTHLPIFPINLMCIVVVVAILLPTTLNYAKYKVEIAEASNLQKTKTISKAMIKEQVTQVKTYRFFIFFSLSVMCIILSIMQQCNSWIFQYTHPIKEVSVLSKELENKVSTLCESNLSFNTLHGQNVIIAKVEKSGYFLGQVTTDISEYTYAITPELKQSIVLMCEKRAEEDKKVMIEKKKKHDEYLKKLMEEEKK